VVTNISPCFSPALLSAFHLNLQAPELGPIVPIAENPLTEGSLMANVDRFLPLAAAMYQEAAAMKAERRPAPIAKCSLIRRLWKRPGLEGYKGTISGLPRDVGPDPKDSHLQWVVSDAYRSQGVETLLLLQKGSERQVKEVRLRRDRGAIHVAVTYGTYGLQVTHQATIGRGERGDFQGLGFQLTHEALDFGATLMESALSVFIDDLHDEKSRPEFQAYFRRKDELAPARLNASFVRVRGGSPFPEWLLNLAKKIESEIS
jgi:hypothetical protein